MRSAMATYSLRCAVFIILVRMPLHTWSLDNCLDLLWDVKIVTIAIVQRSHELRMAQAPDFVAKLVDDVSFPDAPAIALKIFQSNDILYKVSTAQQSQLWKSLLLSMADALAWSQHCGQGTVFPSCRAVA